MREWVGQLQTVVLTFWVGALWTTGVLVAPLIFRTLPDRVLAGALAGALFSTIATAGLLCGTLLVAGAFVRHGRECLRKPFAWLTLVMVLLTAAGQFGIQPTLAALKGQAAPLDVMQSPLRESFANWHVVASSLYLVNCVLGLALVVVHYRADRRGDSARSRFA